MDWRIFLAEAGSAGLRMLPPEAAHKAALLALRTGLGPRVSAERAGLATSVAGLKLPNPIGLAAGFDKDCVAADALLAAGFGFVECGTVTPKPQPGNPKPRQFRLTEDRAAINRMGFNNEGLDAFVERMKARKWAGALGANVGANKDSADRAADYVEGVKRVWAHADYVTINISSPNTPGLRGLQERGALEDLLGRVREARPDRVKPLFLKVAPDLDDVAVSDIVEVAVGAGINALIISNTTIERPASLLSAAKNETGGLSGRPLFSKSTAVLKLAALAAKGRLALIGAGGVESGETALAKIKAGASAVQLYTAMAFEGPGLVSRIARELAERLKADGFASVSVAVGADLK